MIIVSAYQVATIAVQVSRFVRLVRQGNWIPIHVRETGPRF